MDVVAAKNWLKRILNTLTDMELDDKLKLRVVTRLMDKRVVVWWDNLKLCSTILMTLNYFVHEFNEQYYTYSTMIRNSRNFQI